MTAYELHAKQMPTSIDRQVLLQPLWECPIHPWHGAALRGWLWGSCTQLPRVRSEPGILVFPRGTNAPPPPASALTTDLFEMLIFPSAEMDHAAELPHFLHWLQQESGDELRRRGVPVRGDKSCTPCDRAPYSMPSSAWVCPACMLKHVFLHPWMVPPGKCVSESQRQSTNKHVIWLVPAGSGDLP